MTWSQNYAPLGGIGISSLVVAIPLVTMLVLLAVRVRAYLAATAGLLLALVIAIGVNGMPPQMALAAAGYGAATGFFPIGWIVLNALFVYDVSVETGGFKEMQNRMSGISGDRRIQALVIAFAFGALIEGFSGFGAPVAITCGLMIGLGFRPLNAAVLALIGNTAPVAFGGVGVPIVMLAKVTGIDQLALSAMVGRQLAPFAILVPFWLITVQAGWRGMLGVWPACLVSGLAFSVAQLLVSSFHGPQLAAPAGGASALIALLVLLRFWKPREVQGHAGRTEIPVAAASGMVGNLRGWLPWLLLTVLVAASTITPVKNALNAAFAPKIAVPGLHLAVQEMPPVVAKATPKAAEFTFNLLSASGSALVVAGVLSGLLLGMGPGRLARLYWHTVKRAGISLLIICIMLAFGFITSYSGINTTLGLAFASTGVLFPFFSPLLGWLGVALTGSDTSSNVLFGNLQTVTARQIGVSPVLTAAANSAGGVMGKMFSAQSIVIASVATGGKPDSPSVSTILRAIFWHSLALALLMGVVVMLQAYVFKWMVVVPPSVAP